jgi:LacI family transcriptional regulator
MPTIHDVAQRAGVSPITVSRVINHSGYASQETRDRVEAAVAELGYVPNRLARSLRSKRTHTLALIITDITNPFFTTVARGVEDTASDAGYTVIFCNTDESETEEQKYLQVVLQQQVDGVLLVPARSMGGESVEMIQKQNTPVVVLDRRMPSGAQVDVVRCESVEGAYQLVKLLIDLRHQHIAVISGPRLVSTAEDRVMGYRRAMADAGLNQTDIVYYGAFTQASGYEMAQQLLALQPRPTAVFAANNLIAIGALKAVQDAGLRVPEDIAMVAFDDLPANLLVFPFLTVAVQPAYEMGRRATQLLLSRLSNPASPDRQEVVLPFELVVRRSSGSALS